LQRFRFIPRCPHPNIALFICRQEHRHRLVVDRRDDRVRRCRQEAVNLMRPWDRLRLGAAITVKRCPDAGEGKQRAFVVERKPHHVFLLCLWIWRWRVFSEAIGRDEASVLWL